MKLYRGIYRSDGTKFDPSHNHNEFWTDSITHAANFAQCESEGQVMPYCVIELEVELCQLKEIPNFNFFHDKEVVEHLWYFNGEWTPIPENDFDQKYTRLNNEHCCDFKFYMLENPKYRTLTNKEILDLINKDQTDIAKFLKKQPCMKRMIKALKGPRI